MTTFQNAPAPHKGRHHRVDSPDRPVEFTGPRPVDQPQAWPRPNGQFAGYDQQSQIPAQRNPGPAYPAAPARPGSSRAGTTHAHPQRPAPAMQVPPMHAYPTRNDGAFAPVPPPARFDAPNRPPAPAAASAAQAPHPAPVAVPIANPRNGLGIAALCLGIVGMLFGLVPFTGFIAFALGAVGIILGLVGFARSRRKIATNTKTAISGVVLSVLAIALGIWGMVIVFSGLNQLSQDLNQISAPTSTPAAGGPIVPADVANPATTAPVTYQLEITGDASKMMVGYGTNNAVSSTSDYQSLPWRKTVEATGEMPYASVTATSFGPGSITCTITDTATGAVVATQTSKSLDNSEYSSATVSCNTMG